MSFKIRLVLINSLVMLAVLAITLNVFLATTRTVADRNLRTELMNIAQQASRVPPRFNLDDPNQPPGEEGPNQRGGPPQRFNDIQRPSVFDETGARVGGPNSFDKPPFPAQFEKAKSGAPIFDTVTFNEEKYLLLTAAFPSREGRVIVQIGRGLSDRQRLEAAQTTVFWSLIPIALILSGLAAYFLAEGAVRPIKRVAQTATELDEDDLSTRLEVKSKDELGQLAFAFNGMLERLESAFGALKRSNEQQRRFVADASHELRTPLTRLKLATSQPSDDPAEMKESLQVASDAANVMTHLVNELVTLARSDAGELHAEPGRIGIASAVQAALKYAESQSGPAPQVSPELGGYEVEIGPNHLHRMLVNLISNAKRHTPESGAVNIHLEVVGDEFAIVVADSGSGIPADQLARLGERFYRGDESRSRDTGSLGLGIAITQTLANTYQGRLEIASAVQKGTTAKLIFPKSRLFAISK
ncbi:MAG: HAMP domain-containing protein [Armatimonadetes bacterium]|nr:HAMP domain-containing protein [Armatimonadota bacterium]